MDFGQYGLSETNIELIKQKSLEGNLIFQQNSIVGSNGTVVSYTPTTGKNFVLIFANYYHIATVLDEITITLKNDTNVRESYLNIVSGSSVYSSPFQFLTFGDVLIGNGSKKYEIAVTGMSGTTTVYGNICGYLEDT